MNEEMKWMKMKWMKSNTKMALSLSMSFSLFGMLLIFGLGFVFPDINPYVAIKWIIIVCTVVFACSLVSFVAMKCMIIKAKMEMGKEGKKPAKRTSRK